MVIWNLDRWRRSFLTQPTAEGSQASSLKEARPRDGHFAPEKVPDEPSEAHTAESKRGKAHPKPITAGSNPPQSRTAEIQKPKPGKI
jgi:hypothetical protein